MRTLKTKTTEERDREEARDFDLEAFQEELRREGLYFPGEVLEDLAALLLRPGLVLVEAPSGAGSSSLVDALGRHLTAGYREPGFARVSVAPGWTDGSPLLGTWDEASRSYRVPPALELWMRALRHKAKPHFLILEGLDLAPPERVLAEILDALRPGATLFLHDDHLRCQPRTGLAEDLRNFFICHQDCAECFFVRPGYPRGVTDAVKDFTPARVAFPPNLTIFGLLTGPAAALPPRVRDAGALLRIPAPGLEELLDHVDLPELQARRTEALALTADLEPPPSPRVWKAVETLLARGVSLERALRLEARG